MTEQNVESVSKKSRLGCIHILSIGFLVTAVIALLTAFWVKQNIYASPFQPTYLDAKEQLVLDSKLAKLEAPGVKQKSEVPAKSHPPSRPLKPEPYSEDDARREISLSEKELNALIAKDPETAKRVAIDLSEDLVSVKLLLPMDDDFPVLGGKTLRLKSKKEMKREPSGVSSNTTKTNRRLILWSTRLQWQKT